MSFTNFRHEVDANQAGTTTPHKGEAMNRAEAARCLAKVCAYLACGKVELAREWGDKLVDMLREAGAVS